MIYGSVDSIVDTSGCDIIFRTWKDKRKMYVEVQNGPHGKQTVLAAAGTIQNWIGGIE